MMEKLQPKLRFPEFKDNWNKVKLKEVSQYFNGGSFENDVKEEGKYELITLKSVDMSGQLAHSRRYLDIEVPTLNKNTLIMILSEQSPGLLGMTALIPTANRYVLNQRVAEIRPYKTIDSYFLSLSINRNQRYFSKLGAGTKVQNISKPNVENFDFFKPSLPEQTKIASFLSSVDEKLNLLKEKKEALETYKKGMMQKIFSQELRFKDDDGNDFADWEEKSLGEVCTLITKGTTPKSFSSSGVNYIKTECFENDFVNFSKCLYIDFNIHSKELKRSQLEENDILFAIAGSIGKVILVKPSILPANTNQALAILRLRKGENHYFILQVLKSDLMQIYIKENVSVGAQPNLNLEQMNLFSFFYPNTFEQTKIADFLSAIDDKITLVSTHIEEMLEYKKGLLQGMFC